jgi:protein SMG8
MVFLHLTPPPTPMEAGGIGGGGEMPEMLFMFSVSSDSYCAFCSLQ